MKNKLLYIFIFFLTLCSCARQQEQNQNKVLVPKTSEAKGYIVPEDSISSPRVILAGKPKIVPAGKPEIILTNTNIHPAGKPQIVIAGKPTVCTPGQDTFSLPLIVPAIDHPFLAGIPEVTETQDAFATSKNLQNINSFSILQGLKHNFVGCMLQDRRGNLWFGTSGGVIKYDGKSFTHFTKKEGLSNNSIKSIIEDQSGNLWFGTSGGVTKYDGKSFTNYTEKEGLWNNSVWSILEDHSGNIWFGTYGGGVIKYDGKTFTHFTEKEGLSNNSVKSIIEDHSGNLWFGTSGGGVSKYDGISFTHFTTKEGLSNNYVWSILEDHSGNLWFGTSGGICEYDGKTFSHFTKEEGLSDNNVWSIIEDQSRNLWVGTSDGVSKYDGKTFTQYTKKEGLSSNIVWSILEDQTGNIWLGTFGGGVSKYEGKTFTHYIDKDVLSNNSVRSILEDRSGNLWFGTSGRGVSKYDGKSFTLFTEKEGLLNNSVLSIIESKNGNIWFGTDGGVSKYDGKSFTNYTETEGLSNNKVKSILEDQNGNLWFGTSSGGVSKFDGKSFTNFTKKEGLSDNYIWSILEDQSGNLWVGTSNGVSKYNGKTFTHYTKEEGLLNNFVRSILEDQSGNLWFGTSGGGISKYDGKTFTNFTENEGLSNNFIFSMMLDKKGNLWIGTRVGLCMLAQDKMLRLQEFLDKRKGLVQENNFKITGNETFLKTFSYEEGLLGVGINGGNTICEAKNGTIWIGTKDRLTAYHPAGDNTDTIPPNVQLTDIELYNEKIDWINLEKPRKGNHLNVAKDTAFSLENGVVLSDFKFDGISKWYGLPENLSLAYNNNFLTFRYIGITQLQSSKVKYQYMLEGIDKNWGPISSHNEATYGNLSHGRYTFKVKAMNSEGYRSKAFAYSFIIRPPWWETLFFKIGIWVLAISGILSIYSWRVASLRKQQKLLELLVTEKTAVVLRQKEDLQNQKNELEIANATKDKFFSIIAHDLRSPFNSFLGFTQILADELPNLSMNQIQMIALSMKESATNLFHLIENLLQWAKMQQELFSFELKMVELLPIVNESIMTVKETAKNKCVEITYSIPHDLTVFADNNVLQMVMRNLLSNAVKFTKQGGKVSLSAKVNDNNSVEISIRDTGIGMSSELVENLFRIDMKTNRKGTEGEPSSGLGLILCKDFIEKQGGRLWVESKEGFGSIFYFSLPLSSDYTPGSDV